MELVWNSEFHKNEKGSEMHRYPRSYEHHVPELGGVGWDVLTIVMLTLPSTVERIDHL